MMISKSSLNHHASEGPYISSLSPLEVTFGERSSADLSSHEDFRKHRARLSRALFRIRRDLHLITRDTKHYRENEKTSSISPQMYDDDARHGWVLLLIAERDAVHSMEIKSLLEARGERNARYRKLMVSKLKRAVATCHKLVAVVENERLVLTKLQFYVYAALISGAYAVAKKQWVRAIDVFSIARCGLDALFGWAPRNEKDYLWRCNGWWLYDSILRQLYGVTGVTKRRLTQVLVEELTSKLVDPSLRLALSQNSPHESSTYLKTFSRRRARESPVRWLAPAVCIVKSLNPRLFKKIPEESISKDIKWRMHEAHIYNDELAQKLYELQKKPGLSDYLCSRWSALVDIHNSDLARSDDMDDAEKVQDDAIVLTYLKYHMLISRVKETLGRVDNSMKCYWPRSIRRMLSDFDHGLKLRSSIFSTIEEISELPGVDNDEELLQGLEQIKRVLGAKKAMDIAESYADVGKFPEALKLLLHVEEQVSGLKEDSVAGVFPYGVVNRKYVQQLKASVRQRLTEVHILAELQSRESRESRESKLVTEDIHQFPSFDSVHRITGVDQHAKIQPVLCNAVLVDVACNYIGYSDAVERGATAASAGDQGL